MKLTTLGLRTLKQAAKAPVTGAPHHALLLLHNWGLLTVRDDATGEPIPTKPKKGASYTGTITDMGQIYLYSLTQK